jgi:hypothetical protein
MQTTLAIIAAALLLVWLFLRRRNAVKETKAPPTTSRPVNTAYHAVSIRFGERACDAAREMSGRRFLSSAAPRLPLADCDCAECSCRFVHHNDRRGGKDRRSPFAAAGSGGGTGSFQQERRERPDRREDSDAGLF